MEFFPVLVLTEPNYDKYPHCIIEGEVEKHQAFSNIAKEISSFLKRTLFYFTIRRLDHIPFSMRIAESFEQFMRQSHALQPKEHLLA